MKEIQEKDYKYSNDGDLFEGFGINLNEYFQPFFKSFFTDKKTFCLQVVNLVLWSFIFIMFLNPVLDKLTGLKVSDNLGLEIMGVVIFNVVIAAFKTNKVFKWHTVFETDYEYTKLWLKRLCLGAFSIYWLKYFYNTYFITDTSTLDSKLK